MKWSVAAAASALLVSCAGTRSEAADGGLVLDETLQEAEVLTLSGRVRGDEMTIGPAFAYGARVEMPEAPGPYSLRGLDEEGETLFSLSFAPRMIADGGGSGFSFAIPFEAEWVERLDRIEFRGPEGVAALDRETGGRALMAISRETGQVRAILRDASDGLPAALAADSAGLHLIRGLPRPRS